VSTGARAVLLGVLVVLAAAIWASSFASKRLERVASGVAALAPRRFETLTVVAAGTGGSHENHLRLGPCVAVGLGQTVLLVDAGRGTAQALRRASIPVEQPAAVLLTSLLPENTLGLDDWLWGVARAGGGARAVIGPPGTRALVEGLRGAHREGARAAAAAFGVEPEPRVEVLEVAGGFSRAFEGLAVSSRLQRGPFAALAWRIEGGGRSAAVSGAGFDADALVENARGADAWVHEALNGASLDDAVRSGIEGADALVREAALHTRLEDVGALAARAGARRLVLVRLRPPPVWALQYARAVAPSFRGPVDVPEDGDEITP
jgi:ribonuclease BN (tRNA processing enzyme)